MTNAISSSIAVRLSPNAGDLTAATFKIPRILLTTKVESASPSISSDIKSIDLPALAAISSTGKIAFMLLIFFSNTKINGSVRMHSFFSGSVIKCADR